MLRAPAPPVTVVGSGVETIAPKIRLREPRSAESPTFNASSITWGAKFEYDFEQDLKDHTPFDTEIFELDALDYESDPGQTPAAWAEPKLSVTGSSFSRSHSSPPQGAGLLSNIFAPPQRCKTVAKINAPVEPRDARAGKVCTFHTFCNTPISSP